MHLRAEWLLCSAVVIACGNCGSTPHGTGGASSTAGFAGGAFDCAFVNGDNCWKTALASSSGCLPLNGTKGMLSGDGTSCEYPSGTVVKFGDPLAIGPSAGVNNFTLSTGGHACLAYSVMLGGWTVTTPAGTVTLAVSADRQSISLTCPGGAVYSGPTQSLSACVKSLPGFDQGEGFSPIVTADGGGPDGGFTGHFTVSFAALDGGTKEGLVFDCQSLK